MRAFFAIGLCLFAVPALAASAAAPSTALTCNSPQHHQMDFWIGDWNATWQGGYGTSRVTKELKDCVVREHFVAAGAPGKPGLHGESVSSYQPANVMWRQTWVDDQNGYLHLSGGPQKDGTFVLQTIRMGRELHMTRMVFADIKPNSFTWHWQQSDDGDAWTDTWVIQYRRIK